MSVKRNLRNFIFLHLGTNGLNRLAAFRSTATCRLVDKCCLAVRDKTKGWLMFCCSQVKVTLTVYNRMGLLLKSLITVSRVTPAYRLSRRQVAPHWPQICSSFMQHTSVLTRPSLNIVCSAKKYRKCPALIVCNFCQRQFILLSYFHD